MSSIRIDRQFVKSFVHDAEQALEAVAKQYGVRVAYKSASYAHSGLNSTVRFDVTAPDPSTGQCLSREAQDFVTHCGRYGFEPSDLGRSFATRGVAYTITGLHTKRHKYPISAERNYDGKPFKFPAGAINLKQEG